MPFSSYNSRKTQWNDLEKSLMLILGPKMTHFGNNIASFLTIFYCLSSDIISEKSNEHILRRLLKSWYWISEIQTITFSHFLKPTHPVKFRKNLTNTFGEKFKSVSVYDTFGKWPTFKISATTRIFLKNTTQSLGLVVGALDSQSSRSWVQKLWMTPRST